MMPATHLLKVITRKNGEYAFSATEAAERSFCMGAFPAFGVAAIKRHPEPKSCAKNINRGDVDCVDFPVEFNEIS